MGQVSVELPDPLEQPSPVQGGPASTKAADDLLSQLAGDEIDRMLAEAGVERGELALRNDETGVRDAESVEAQALEAAEDVAEQLNELFSQLNHPLEKLEHAEAEAKRAAGGEAVEESPPEVGRLEDVELAVEEMAVTSEEMDTVLSEGEELGAGRVEAASNVGRNLIGNVAGVCLKPLVWMNAPVAACPAGLRDALGKAAIVTLVNAAAVLVYVLVFRGGE